MAVSSIKTFTIPAGGTQSNQADLGILDKDQELVGFQVVGAVISTAMTFKVSDDGALFQTLNTQAGAAVSVSIGSNVAVGLNQDTRAQLGRWRFMQIVMGSTETGGATIRAMVK